jgi:hypothetical protein
VTSLSGCVVATEVTFANAANHVALLGNVSLDAPDMNPHWVTATVFGASGRRFPLARYHDVDFDRSGPRGLAQFLGLRIEEIFPIRYDISHLARGAESCVRGEILAAPRHRLSREELVALAIQ